LPLLQTRHQKSAKVLYECKPGSVEFKNRVSLIENWFKWNFKTVGFFIN
jgi:hypothetical protein